MALKSTVFKANLAIADMDRGYYADHAVTLARHPSENDERMMVRLLAFALHAHERLTFGKGLSDPDDPDLVERDLTGAIVHWIEVGCPDDRAILRACAKADRVSVIAYGTAASVWWPAIAPKLSRARNLSVVALQPPQSQALAGLAQRSMQLQCNVQDGTAWVGSDQHPPVQVDIQPLSEPPPARPR
jgi:uncharacterized protein YaeQ